MTIPNTKIVTATELVGFIDHRQRRCYAATSELNAVVMFGGFVTVCASSFGSIVKRHIDDGLANGVLHVRLETTARGNPLALYTTGHRFLCSVRIENSSVVGYYFFDPLASMTPSNRRDRFSTRFFKNLNLKKSAPIFWKSGDQQDDETNCAARVEEYLGAFTIETINDSHGNSNGEYSL